MPSSTTRGRRRSRRDASPRRFAPPAALQSHQTQRATVVLDAQETQFFDVGLDNSDVEFDDQITAARKCGFCMG